MPAADELRAWRARPPRVVVVEDATEMAEAIRLTLASEGFEVQVAHDGDTGLELARSTAPDVVLLDIDLPDIDGWEVCRQLRTFSDAYVVMLTVHADEFDRVLGLSSGADDYITKPFSSRELVARIRAMLRRPRTARSAGVDTGAVQRFGELTIDTGLREIRVGERVVELSHLEYGILATLAEHSRQTLSRGSAARTGMGRRLGRRRPCHRRARLEPAAQARRRSPPPALRAHGPRLRLPPRRRLIPPPAAVRRSGGERARHGHGHDDQDDRDRADEDEALDALLGAELERVALGGGHVTAPIRPTFSVFSQRRSAPRSSCT